MNMWKPALISLTLDTFISGITSAGGYITYTTTSAHGLSKNDIVTITNATTSGFNLTNAVVYDVTSTTFRILKTVTGTTSTASLTYYLSDHNRSPVQQSYEIIQNSKRMANGTMRKYVVASKKSWSVSWDMFPGVSSKTVDGYLGAMSLQALYDNHYDIPITLNMYAGSTTGPTGAKQTLPAPTAGTPTKVFISSFSCTINKRFGDIDYWSVSMEFVEV